MSNSRRSFIKKAAAGSAALMAEGILPGFTAESYRRILGANDKIRASIMGVNSRGNALAQNFAFQKECDVLHICDVDSRVIERRTAEIEKKTGKKPIAVEDYRKLIGATDPAQAEEGTVRKLYARSKQFNAVHGSDSDENAVKEIAFFFSSKELIENYPA